MLIRDNERLIVGRGPVRTRVTAILPRGRRDDRPVFAAIFSQNGNGEMTGSRWIEESGVLAGPVTITNTHSVRVVHDALIAWQVERRRLDRGHPRPTELRDALPAHDCRRLAFAASVEARHDGSERHSRLLKN